MFKNSENTLDTKVSKWAAQNWLYLQNDNESEHRTDFNKKRYDRSLWFDTQLDLVCYADSDWGGLNVVEFFLSYALHRTRLQVSTICLNKKYSRYDGTEVIQWVLSLSKSSKYMFKNSELPQRTGHGRWWHQPVEVLHTACDRKALEMTTSG